MSKNKGIGIFDSGLGGLSVWRAVRDLLPCESIVYLGDGKNCPYGSKSVDDIIEYSHDAVSKLIDMGCKLIVVACNTATAAAIDLLRSEYPNIPIVGMEPALKPAATGTKSGVVGVLATERSLGGKLYNSTAAKYGSKITVLPVVGEGFVEIVESQQQSTPEALEQVRKVVDPIIEKGADHIVLGCTHYPFLMNQIQQVVGNRNVIVVDPSNAVARRVKNLLEQNDLLTDSDARGEYEFVSFAGDEYCAMLKNYASKL